ncbi:MAG: hypothetical protein RLZZ533_1526 [Cyanobacteriota bacterium]
MLELAMAPANGHEEPPLLEQPPDHLPNLQPSPRVLVSTVTEDPNGRIRENTVHNRGQWRCSAWRSRVSGGAAGISWLQPLSTSRPRGVRRTRSVSP